MRQVLVEALHKVQEDEHEGVELLPDVSGRGMGSIRLPAVILMGMVAVLAIIAVLLAPSGHSTGEPLAAAPKRAQVRGGEREVAEPKLTTEAESAGHQAHRTTSQKGEKRHKKGDPLSSVAPQEEQYEPPPEPRAGDERDQHVEQAARPRPSSAGRTATSRPPRSDASVAARMRNKILARCRSSGGTRVTIEGIIGTGGRVLSPIVTPSGEPGACAERVARSIPFDPRQEMRAMPVVTVML